MLKSMIFPMHQEIVMAQCLTYDKLTKSVKVVKSKCLDSCGQVKGNSHETSYNQRLELNAAVLAVRLNCQLQEELEIPIQRVVFWTDSMVVLQYINNESKRFQTFVANRLAVIHELSKPSMWRHVGTKSNPADYASRV